MTPRDIIRLALKNAGVLGQGQTATAEQTNDIYLMLNAMIGQWAVKRWLIYHLVNYTHVATGALTYTVGPGGDFDIPVRPVTLEAAFVSQNPNTPQQIDTPLDLLLSREDFNRISMKDLISIPYYLFYDNGFPLGTVYPWPAPNAGIYSLTLTVRDTLRNFTGLSQDIILPEEYQEALIYNLAARIRPFYQLDPDLSIVGLARSALNTIRQANTQIPRLQMPMGMARSGRYNIYSDQGR